MAYSHDLPEMARLKCSVAIRLGIAVIVTWRYIAKKLDYHGLSWTIMDYYGQSWTIMDILGLS